MNLRADRLAHFLALMDYSSGAIAFALVDGGMDGPSALALADEAVARQESRRKERDEAVRQSYADALRSEHEE